MPYIIFTRRRTQTKEMSKEKSLTTKILIIHSFNIRSYTQHYIFLKFPTFNDMFIHTYHVFHFTTSLLFSHFSFYYIIIVVVVWTHKNSRGSFSTCTFFIFTLFTFFRVYHWVSVCLYVCIGKGNTSHNKLVYQFEDAMSCFSSENCLHSGYTRGSISVYILQLIFTGQIFLNDTHMCMECVYCLWIM